MKTTLSELQQELEDHMRIHGDALVSSILIKAIKSSFAINGRSLNERQLYYADVLRMSAKVLLTEPIFWQDILEPNNVKFQ